MKLRRRLFTGGAGLSLVLCVLTVPAWLLNRWLVVNVHYVQTDPPASAPARMRHFSIQMGSGGIGMFAVTLVPFNAADASQWAAPTPVPRGGSLRYQWLPFSRTRWIWKPYFGLMQAGDSIMTNFDGVASSVTGVSVFVPYWVMALAFLIVPGLKLMQWQAQRRRVRKGLCATCGYDLRATPDRCPECGTTPKAAI